MTSTSYVRQFSGHVRLILSAPVPGGKDSERPKGRFTSRAIDVAMIIWASVHRYAYGAQLDPASERGSVPPT